MARGSRSSERKFDGRKIPRSRAQSGEIMAAVQHILKKPFHRITPEELAQVSSGDLIAVGVNFRSKQLMSLRDRHKRKVDSGGYDTQVKAEDALGKNWLEIDAAELVPEKVKTVLPQQLSTLRTQKKHEQEWKPRAPARKVKAA